MSTTAQPPSPLSQQTSMEESSVATRAVDDTAKLEAELAAEILAAEAAEAE